MNFNLAKTENNICFITFFLYYLGLMIFDLNEKYLFISHILFLWIAMLAGVLIIRGKSSLLIKPYTVFLGLFIFVAFISSACGIDFTNSTYFLSTLFKIMLMCIFIYQLLYRSITDDNIERLFFHIGIIFFIWILLVYGISDFISALIGNTGRRLGAEVSQENVMGINAALICSILIFYILNQFKIKYILVICMMFLIIAVSGSKKAFLVIPFTIVVSAFYKYGFRRFYKLLILTVILLMATFILFQLPIFSTLNDRMDVFIMQLQGNDADSSTKLRMQMICSGLVWFTDAPIFGVGIDNYKILFERAYGAYRYSHNNYIEVLVNTGIIGFFIYYFIYIYLLYKLYKRRKHGSLPQILSIILLIQIFLDVAQVSYLSKITYINLIMAFVYLDKTSKIERQMNCSNYIRLQNE